MDQAPITLEGIAEKAIADATTGDLMLEGWAAKYDDPDRQGEYFMPGAFQRAVDAVKSGRVPLLYQHREGSVLGQVQSLEEKADGVWMRALVPQPKGGWAVDVYDKLKRKMVTGLSAKGMFTKMLLPEGGARIKDVDLFEISATPVPVGASATIEVVAQKALDLMGDEEADELFQQADAALSAYFDRMNATLDAANAALEARR